MATNKTTIDEFVTRIKNNTPLVYEKGKTEGVEEGLDAAITVQEEFLADKPQTHYDAFWDAYQWSGQRWNYSYAFAYDAWTDETFNPKYPIGTGWDLNLNNTFRDAERITRIPLIKPASWTNYTDAFLNCGALVEVRFQASPGHISNNISFADSPLLSRESIESVVSCLSDTTTGKTATFHSTAKANAFTDAEWTALVATKPNWTISLV